MFLITDNLEAYSGSNRCWPMLADVGCWQKGFINPLQPGDAYEWNYNHNNYFPYIQCDVCVKFYQRLTMIINIVETLNGT